MARLAPMTTSYDAVTRSTQSKSSNRTQRPLSVPEAVQDLTLVPCLPVLSFSLSLMPCHFHPLVLTALSRSYTDTPHLYFTYFPCFSISFQFFRAQEFDFSRQHFPAIFPLPFLSHRPRPAKKNRRQADLRELVGSPAAPSPRKRTFTSLPFNPFARITCGSPGTKSIPWSPHATSSSPSATSNTTPLIGFSVASWTDSPSESTLTDSPSAWTGGKVMYLKGSGLGWERGGKRSE